MSTVSFIFLLKHCRKLKLEWSKFACNHVYRRRGAPSLARNIVHVKALQGNVAYVMSGSRYGGTQYSGEQEKLMQNQQ